ncbi:glycosyltransferase family 2 protein [Enhydrobacter aerosaccus]|uniref:glycosyltransferase family 2 protein n=1 Tax=Enhydrobacter aerosaccus TaxID=225324 RepID=UPI001481D38B|nr:glycosyltransferase [Enhydrobacter aerosaccus]
MNVESGDLRFHIDEPDKVEVLITARSTIRISGWAVDLRTLHRPKIRIRVGKSEYAASAVPRQDVQEALAIFGAIPVDSGFASKIELPFGRSVIDVETEDAPGQWRTLRRQAILCFSIARIFSFRTRSQVSGSRGYYFHIDRPKRRRFELVENRRMLVSGWAIDTGTGKRLNVEIKIGGESYTGNPKAREDVANAFVGVCSLPLECGFELLVTLSIGIQKIELFLLTPDDERVPIFSSWLLFVPWSLSNQEDKLTYRKWKEINQKLVEQQLPELRDHITNMLYRPKFTVVIYVDNEADLKATLVSIKQQIYACSQVWICGSTSMKVERSTTDVRYASTIPWMELTGDFVIFLRSGYTLRREALYSFASFLNRDPNADLIYADEERQNGSDILSFFKPAWSPDYLESFNYIGYGACFRISLANLCSKPAGHYDFVLRFTEIARRVCHVDQVLFTCAGRESKGSEGQAGVAALESRLLRTGRKGQVTPGNQELEYFRIKVEPSEKPLVSVVIPTAGQVVQHNDQPLDLILNCVAQIRDRTSYKNIEIVVVDNDDLSHRQLATLEQAQCKRITFREPKFNVAKKLNLGASIASGDILLLLNDDIEILSTDWIERMLEHFEKPHVGVVGPKLLYRDLTTQHVGVVHNSGNPDHVRRLFPRDDAGYFFSTGGVRNFGAVTGACMMTRRSVYQEVGGYSEELAISYNDTDYCMKVQRLGLSIVYTPYAELIHFESQSRVPKLDIDEAHWYQQTWARESVSDPYYNERFLSVASPTFEVTINPRLL